MTSEPPLPESNDPMLDLFFTDFLQQTTSLRKLLEINVLGEVSAEQLQQAQRSMYALRGASSIVRFDMLTKIALRLVGVFDRIKDARTTLPEGAAAIFAKTATVFEALVTEGAKGIAKRLKELDKECQDVLVAIDKFMAENAARQKEAQEAAAAAAKEVQEAAAIAEEEAQASSVPSPEPLPSETEKKSVPKVALDIDLSMVDLFRTELESQLNVFSNCLVEFEQTEKKTENLEALMRSSHSIKGAARVVGLTPIEKLAHVMEDCFVAAQEQKLTIDSNGIDLFLEALDFFSQIASIPNENLQEFLLKEQPHAVQLAANLLAYKNGEFKPLQAKASVDVQPKKQPSPVAAKPAVPPPPVANPQPKPDTLAKPKVEPPKEKAGAKGGAEPRTFTKTAKEAQDRILRVTAQNLNRLMGLAGESLVESRWLQPFSDSLMKVKKSLNELSKTLDLMRDFLEDRQSVPGVEDYLTDLQHRSSECRQSITDRLAELEMFIIRHSSLSDRLYREVIDSRMRPFADGVEGFPRLVRDLAKHLGKKVRLEILGKTTPVDREILEKLDSPLNHLIRNAIDHGIETPEERISRGKNPEGLIILEAQHRAGMLAITITDDGRGIDLEDLRETLIQKNLVKASLVKSLTESELLDFLFLPGFSTASHVTEISGRGVGLNVVHTMIQEVSGNIRVSTQPGKGMTFHLQLPLTLSVIRALIVQISNEPYAFPLARIDRALLIPKDQIDVVENRQYFNLEGQNIGLVSAQQVLGIESNKVFSDILPVIVLSDRHNCYGIVVDTFLGERELVVQELDSRLGKTQDISSGALMEDGSPVLVVDIEDMVRSIDTILTGGRLHRLSYGETTVAKAKKRILVVDDSITVREVESRLLQNHGYDVQSAINGMDGWNALRMGSFDLVVTDVDMPRMNGIELVKNIRADAKTKNLPVMIVSYKEREEDRLKGMEAGANYYLTKSGFHDETLLRAVEDLIGKP